MRYVGARYVPKFYENSQDGSTQWESNVVYEPLIWVTLPNDHMYLSKKQVPATIGSPADNIDYWLEVGSYNGYVSNLQDEIDTINATLTGYQDEIDVINNGYLTPEEFGAKGDGVTDDITAINQCISEAWTQKKTVRMSHVTYAISAPISIVHPTYIDGNYATIYALNTMQSMVDVNIPDPVASFGRGVISKLLLKCNYKASYGIYIQRNINSVRMDNIQMNDPLAIGVYALSEVRMDHTVIRNTSDSHLDIIGIKLDGPDNYISDYMAVNTLVSMEINGSQTHVFRNTSWNSFAGLMQTSVFTKLTVGATFIDCLADTWATCFENPSGVTLIPFIIGCSMFWNPTYYNDAAAGTTYATLFKGPFIPYDIGNRGYAPTGRSSAYNVIHYFHDLTGQTTNHNPIMYNVYEKIYNYLMTVTTRNVPHTIQNITDLTVNTIQDVQDYSGRYYEIDIAGTFAGTTGGATPFAIISNLDDYLGSDRVFNLFAVITDTADYAQLNICPVKYQAANHRFLILAPSNNTISAGHIHIHGRIARY